MDDFRDFGMLQPVAEDFSDIRVEDTVDVTSNDNMFAIDNRFTNEMLGKFRTDLRRDLDASVASKVQIDARIRRYRRYYALDKDAPQYEGQPNHVVPYIRAKISGATAHFRGALDQDPFFTVRPYTSEAEKNRPVWEIMMERELDRSSTQRQLFMSIEEACLTGTGVMQLSVTKPFDEYLVQGTAVRLEDFYVAPAGVSDISRISTFYRYREPWHVIQRQADAGEYDPDAVMRVKQSTTTSSSYDEDMDGTRTFAYQGDNQLYELWECYYRWGSDDIGHTLWRVVFSQDHNVILRVEESPYLECFDAPPYVPLRPMPRVGYFYGESYSQVLEGIQNIMDFAYNSKIAHDQIAIAPPVFVDDTSPAWEYFTNKGMAPGVAIPTRGNPMESIFVTPIPPASEAMDLLQTARALGEDATFSDLQLQGIPTSTVRSATEINAMTNAANKKLAEDLSNLAYDLSIFARMYWSMIYKFKIEPAGVMPVFNGSDQYLIAASELSDEDIARRMIEYIQQSSGMMFGPENQQEMVNMALEQQRRSGKFFISSARRDDMEWVPNGGTLVPDKLVRAQKMQSLLQTMMPTLQMAMQFKPFWHAMKDWLISMDIHNWTDYLPAQSPEAIPSAEDMVQFSGMMNQMRVGGGE